MAKLPVAMMWFIVMWTVALGYHATAAAVLATMPAHADESAYSGPQVREKLPPLTVTAAFDTDNTKDYDLVARAGGKPMLLVFIHDLLTNRTDEPSLGLAYLVMQYAAERQETRLARGIVCTTDDVTELRAFLEKIRRVFPRNDTPIGISLDGLEGPGSYGLNRNVRMTILIAKDNKVIHLSYVDHDSRLWYRTCKSPYRAGDWTAPVKLKAFKVFTNVMSLDTSQTPARVYLLYGKTEFEHPDRRWQSGSLFLSKFDGKSWSDPVIVSEPGTKHNWYPNMNEDASRGVGVLYLKGLPKNQSAVKGTDFDIMFSSTGPPDTSGNPSVSSGQRRRVE